MGRQVSTKPGKAGSSINTGTSTGSHDAYTTALNLFHPVLPQALCPRNPTTGGIDQERSNEPHAPREKLRGAVTEFWKIDVRLLAGCGKRDVATQIFFRLRDFMTWERTLGTTLRPDPLVSRGWHIEENRVFPQPARETDDNLPRTFGRGDPPLWPQRNRDRASNLLSSIAPDPLECADLCSRLRASDNDRLPWLALGISLLFASVLHIVEHWPDCREGYHSSAILIGWFPYSTLALLFSLVPFNLTSLLFWLTWPTMACPP